MECDSVLRSHSDMLIPPFPGSSEEQGEKRHELIPSLLHLIRQCFRASKRRRRWGRRQPIRGGQRWSFATSLSKWSLASLFSSSGLQPGRLGICNMVVLRLSSSPTTSRPWSFRQANEAAFAKASCSEHWPASPKRSRGGC